jgi:hypothetical protein
MFAEIRFQASYDPASYWALRLDSLSHLHGVRVTCRNYLAWNGLLNVNEQVLPWLIEQHPEDLQRTAPSLGKQGGH